MSLAQRLATIAPAARNRILILDVERVDGITQQHYWDRGDLQKRYVHHETVIREPRTTIVCAKWYDQPEVIQLAEWDEGGRYTFLRRVHALMAAADIIVGHNLDNADVPWLTLKILRREFKSGAPFKSLDAFCQIVGIPSKTDHYDREAMERAVGGSVEDRVRLTDYCAGDVVATQWLYDWERPHIKSHPALFVDGQDKLRTCNRCGHETTDVAKRYVANVLTYSMRRCTNCGGYSRLSIEPERMSLMRGV
jgi:hypothetical protein